MKESIFAIIFDTVIIYYKNKKPRHLYSTQPDSSCHVPKITVFNMLPSVSFPLSVWMEEIHVYIKLSMDRTNLKTGSPPILPLTLSRLSPCLVSKIGRGVRCAFTCKSSYMYYYITYPRNK